MATATVRAPQPKNEKGRLAGRPSRNLAINNDKITDSAAALRVQRLRLLGIIGARAALIAPLVWGEVA